MLCVVRSKLNNHNTLRWRHNEHDGVSNHQPRDYSLNRLFRRRSKKTSKLHVTGLTGLCKGNSPVNGEFPTQRARNAENISIWWGHYELHVSAGGTSPREIGSLYPDELHMTLNCCPSPTHVIRKRLHYTNLAIIYSTVYSGADQRKRQSYVSLALQAFVRGIHRWNWKSLSRWALRDTRSPSPTHVITKRLHNC